MAAAPVVSTVVSTVAHRLRGGQPDPAERCDRDWWLVIRDRGGAVYRRTRLHELGDLVQPAPVPGRLVPVTESDLDLVAEGVAAFTRDTEEQAGTVRAAGSHEFPGAHSYVVASGPDCSGSGSTRPAALCT